MSRHVGTDEAAERFGVSARRLRQLLLQGRVRGAVKVSGVWMIPLEEDGQPWVEYRPAGRPTQPNA